jgi:hypothetical protein
MPNISGKIGWGGAGRFRFATAHGAACPTPFLKFVSRAGAGGILPADTKVPFLLSFDNRLLVTGVFSNYFIVTGKAGAHAATSFGEQDMATIDYPLIFHRTSAYYHTACFYFGMDVTGILYKKFGYLIDADLFLTRDPDGSFALESKGLILWRKSRKLSLCLGYKIIYGSYPFGRQLDVIPFYNLPVPLIDVQFGFN